MKLILFDFDGVLANTEKLCYRIHTVKNKDLTWERFQEYSNGNFFDGYFKAVKEGKHIPADDYDGSYKKILDVLTIQDILHESILYLAKNYRLAIVSSTDSSYINDFLRKEGLLEYFSDVLGMDTHLSKKFKIKKILEKYNLLPDDTIFITDTLGDIREANECGVRSIGVTWGLHDREALLKGKPIKIIDNPQDLVQSIKEI